MTGVLQLNLFSPEKPRARVQAKSLIVPAMLGEIGVLPGHAQLQAQLKPGILKVEAQDEKNASYTSRYFLDGGFLQVNGDQVTIISEVIESKDDVDVDRAQKSEDRALQRLGETTNLDIDIERAMSALARAKARQQLKQLQNK